jgi:hypothetical protein
MDLRKIGNVVWTGLFWLRIGTSGGILLKCNEPSGYIKVGKFLRR